MDKDLDLLEKELDEMGFTSQKIEKLFELAQIFVNNNNPSKAEYLIIEALTISQILDDKKSNCISHIKLGEIYSLKDDFDTALDYFEKADNFFELPLKDHIKLKIQIAKTYISINKSEKAIHFYSEGLHYAEITKEDFWCAELHRFLGKTYNTLGLIQQAFDEFSLAKDWFKASNFDLEYIDCLQEISFYHIKKRNFDKATETLNIINDSLEKDDKIAIFYLNFSFAQIAFQTHDLENIDKYLDTCEKLVKKLQDSKIEKTFYFLKAKVAEDKNDFEAASIAFENYIKAENSIFDENLKIEVEKVDKRFKNELINAEKDFFTNHFNRLEKMVKDKEKTYSELEKTQEKILRLEQHNASLAVAVTANHELNQPLMIIQGSLDLLEMLFEKINFSDGRDEMKIIQEGINEIDEVLTSLKELTYKIKKNKEKIELEYE